MANIRITLPIRIVSEANLTDHWTVKNRRKKEIQFLIRHALKNHKKPDLPVRIVLTRIAPRQLDHDNHVAAQKSTIDAVADWLVPGKAPGRADGHPGITIDYCQEKAGTREYGLKIEIISIPTENAGNQSRPEATITTKPKMEKIDG